MVFFRILHTGKLLLNACSKNTFSDVFLECCNFSGTVDAAERNGKSGSIIEEFGKGAGDFRSEEKLSMEHYSGSGMVNIV